MPPNYVANGSDGEPLENYLQSSIESSLIYHVPISNETIYKFKWTVPNQTESSELDQSDVLFKKLWRDIFTFSLSNFYGVPYNKF